MNAAQLQSLPRWAALPDREALALVSMGIERHFRAGAAVGAPNLGDSAPLLIVAGECKLLLDIGDLSLPVASLTAGDWWNADSAFDNAGCPLSLRALTDTRAFLIPKEAWASLATRQAALSLHLLRQALAAQLRIATALAPHAARWQHTAAAKRKPTTKDLLELGMNKLIAPTTGRDAQVQRDVELVGHQGPAIAAAFKIQR